MRTRRVRAAPQAPQADFLSAPKGKARPRAAAIPPFSNIIQTQSQKSRRRAAHGGCYPDSDLSVTGTSRASCSVVGDVERSRCSNALPIPVPTPAFRLHCVTPRRSRAMSQNLRSQVLRQALRLFPRATVIGHADVHSPLPKAMNRATRGVLIPSVRVMLSANVSGDAKARHHIRHRARHGLAPSLGSYGGTCRGSVAIATSTLRSCCPRRSRAVHAAPAPRQALAQAGCRVAQRCGLRGVALSSSPSAPP
jgi:hypothetical protein